MPYTFETPSLGMPKIGVPQAAFLGAGRSVPWKAGDIKQAIDPVYGAGEFIYLAGIPATAVGTLVTYDPFLGTTTIVPAAGGVGPVAVAMSANILATTFDWYQITGVAAVKAPNAMVRGAGVYMLAATPGSVDDAVVAGEQIQGAVVTSTTGTPSAGLALITINRPSIV